MQIWEVIDGDFVELACGSCAQAFLKERGIEAEPGKDYYGESISACEDTFGQHNVSDCKVAHSCFSCHAILDDLQTNDLDQTVQAIYELSGQWGVHEFVAAKQLVGQLQDVDWKRCSPCDTLSPIYESSCLVCGTTIKEKN